MVFLRKTSLVDFPGRVSAVIFFPGCNLRCPWCQNGELAAWSAPKAAGLDSEREGVIPLEKALAHIAKRKDILGGVVLSGGEPTLRQDLGEVITGIKSLDLPIKLDTNGMNPAVLEDLCSQKALSPDYIALDLKIAPGRYGELLPNPQNAAWDPGKALEASAAIIRNSGIAHEFRTLILPGGYITQKDIALLAPLTDDAPWYLRPFIPGTCLSETWNGYEKTGSAEGEALLEEARLRGKNPILMV